MHFETHRYVEIIQKGPWPNELADQETAHIKTQTNCQNCFRVQFSGTYPPGTKIILFRMNTRKTDARPRAHPV